MAGIKRKVDNSRSSSAHTTAVSESSTQGQTRMATHGKGTRGSTRLAAPAPDTPSALSSDNAASEATGMTPRSNLAAEEQEPRPKRLRLVTKAAETPKATRYSTRSKAPDSSSAETPQLSRRQSVDGGGPSSQPASSTRRLTRQLSSKSGNINSADSLLDSKNAAENVATPTRKATATTSPSKSLRGRKRQAEDASKEETAETENSPTALKKPKLEDDEPELRLSPDDSNTVDGSQNAKIDSPAPVPAPVPVPQETVTEECTDSKTTDDINGSITNPTNSTESNTTQNQNARGRGGRSRGTGRARGYRGRGRGGATRGGGAPFRGSGRGRGFRGGGGGGGGGRGGGKAGKRGDDDSDFEAERSPSPVPGSQKLLDRQKELKQGWKRLAATQRLLLKALAERTENRLIRDKTAHRKVEEFEEVQAALEAALEKKLQCLKNEYRLRVDTADAIWEAQKSIINDRFEANACNIREELYYAARGDYMAVVEGVQHAEDEEHTEPDVDQPEPAEVTNAETGSSYEPLYRDEAPFRRGFNSKFIREPSGAASYELGRNDWDEFVQRAKMKKLGQEEAAPAGPDTLDILLQAVDVVGQAVASLESGLSTLADAASNAPPVPQHQHQHQHQPPPPPQTQTQPPKPREAAAEPPSYLLPQPAPTRPVLPSTYNLPNPFTTGRGPPQLPPPAGIAFCRPQPPPPPGSGLPGFLVGPQPQQPPVHQYQPTPAPGQGPAPSPGPGPGPGPYYYSGHPSSGQSPPPRHHPY